MNIFKELDYKDRIECYLGAGEGIGELVGYLLKNELMDFHSIPLFCRDFFYKELDNYLYCISKYLNQLPEPAKEKIYKGIDNQLRKEGIDPSLKNHIFSAF